MAGGAALLVGCTGGRDRRAGTTRSPSSATADTGTAHTGPAAPPPPPPPALPRSRVWRVRDSEVEPHIKRAAVRLVEALGQWSPGDDGEAAAAHRLRRLSATPSRADHLAHQAGPLLGDYREATIRVIASQYGGLLESSASVLVATQQWKRRPDSGEILTGGVTVDVRLSSTSRGWEVNDIRPSRPGPPVRPASRLVRRVVRHPRIHLPPAARADVLAGSLRPKPMRALLDLARDYEVDVSVVHSGHPYYVFGTDRLSDHTRMRAFDVWAINRQPIVARSTPDNLVDRFMRDAVDAGAYNVGGPRLLPGGYFFSDPSHHDHTHIAFDSDV
jgi:hypothetical protein